jgi:hypothetical protein
MLKKFSSQSSLWPYGSRRLGRRPRSAPEATA